MTSTTANPFTKLLEKQGHIILDGALATELERRGFNLSSSTLWSAEVLLNNPDAIYQVHLDYFKAGADVAITSSYQASTQGLQQHGIDLGQSRKLIEKSVELAKRARDEIMRTEPGQVCLIAGSVGPYGAYLANGAEYSGDYHLAEAEMKAFHRPRMEVLLAAGVDLLACETIPSFDETVALLHLLDEFPAATAWFSFTLKDAHHISDGTPLEWVAHILEKSAQVVAVGFNCMPASVIDEALRNLASVVTLPLLAYPNSGEEYDAVRKEWHAGKTGDSQLATIADNWRNRGVRILGGCCRTTPSDIRALKSAFEASPHCST
jgi:homocysteine S-methyltransferase